MNGHNTTTTSDSTLKTPSYSRKALKPVVLVVILTDLVVVIGIHHQSSSFAYLSIQADENVLHLPVALGLDKRDQEKENQSVNSLEVPSVDRQKTKSQTGTSVHLSEIETSTASRKTTKVFSRATGISSAKSPSEPRFANGTAVDPSRMPIYDMDHPENHPLLLYHRHKLPLSDIPVLPVVHWPYVELERGSFTAEVLHLQISGTNDSQRLELLPDLNTTNASNPYTIWAGDFGTSVNYAGGVCNELETRVRKAQADRKQLGMPLAWPIVMLDFTDVPNFRRCKNLEQLFNSSQFLIYNRRSVVRKRMFNESWVQTGFRMNDTESNAGDPKRLPHFHTPLFVRTDMVQVLEQTLQHRSPSYQLHESIEDAFPRPIQVSHFWPVNGTGVNPIKSKLRHKASLLLEDMKDRQLLQTAFVGLAGSTMRSGRQSAQHGYVETMLQSQIIVVTQRDEWEDHYRLFEAMITGAMVITDRVLSLPDQLQNGTSVVEVESEADLEQKLLYYLEHDKERISIAKEGRRVAMGRHRAWHRIEDAIFRRPATECLISSRCPYIVHPERKTR